MNFKKIIFWSKNYCRRHAMKAWNAALAYETLSGAEKQRLSFQRRCDLVKYAYENNRFYRDFYDRAGFHPDMLNTEEDWVRVPILEKEQVRVQGDSLLSSETSRSEFYRATTGGSTGTPLHVWKDKRIPWEVLTWRSLMWNGVHPASNMGFVHRKVPQRWQQKLRSFLLWYPTRRCYLNASCVSPVDMDVFLQTMARIRPEYLVGYCGALEQIADYITSKQFKMDHLKMVWSTSSPLISTVRKKMEKAFRCRIVDQYGCCEIQHLAIQRGDEHWLTVNSDYICIDLANEDGCLVQDVDCIGDILATDLTSFGYPLIKYRLGDRGSWHTEPWQAADGFPKLNFVQGRISDMVWRDENTFLDGSYLTTVCDSYSNVIDQYQIRQSADYSIEFLFVLKSGIAIDSLDVLEFRRRMEKELGLGQRFTMKQVEEICHDRGKRRFIISEIVNGGRVR